jgi:hypothetical protein
MRLRNIFLAITCFFLISTLSYGAGGVLEKDALADRQELVREIQKYELSVGFTPTNNFKTYEDTVSAIYLCYHSDKFDLTTYFTQGTKDGCSIDEHKYDVFFYPAQAIAGVNVPLMSSLAKDSIGRFIMVVFHEDFHEQVVGIPTTALNESSTTLMGLLLAREFASEKYGAQSDVVKNITADIELFLRGALIEEQYASSLRSVYAQVRSGEKTRDDGLSLKEILFEEMRNECSGLRSKLLSTCSAIQNNAHFGYHLNYTTHYPLFYQLYEACGQDVKVLSTTIISLVKDRLSEEKFILKVQKIINSKRA